MEFYRDIMKQEISGTMRDARRACLWLRTAVRVRRWIARFPCPDADALYRNVAAVLGTNFRRVAERVWKAPRGS